jgi:hypothetical protein
MSKYTVTSVDLGSLPGVHDGTGTQTHSWNVCEPSSVGANVKTPLSFMPMHGTIQALCFDLAERVVPSRFAVAVPAGAGGEAFNRVNIFFHPNPQHAGMTDAAYPAGGAWPKLYRYTRLLGTQLAAAGNKMVLVMPYMKAASSQNAGILATDWHDVILAVLDAAKAKVHPGHSSQTVIKDVVVSSYSFGIRYSDSFRHSASKSLHGVLRSVWDFDGAFTPENAATQNLHSSAGCGAIKYDQAPVSSVGTNFHVPLARWTKCPPSPPKTVFDVHDQIPGSLFLHACKVGAVG